MTNTTNTTTATDLDKPEMREEFVAYWKARHQYRPDFQFLDRNGNFCTPEDDPIHMNYRTWLDASLARSAAPAPAVEPFMWINPEQVARSRLTDYADSIEVPGTSIKFGHFTMPLYAHAAPAGSTASGVEQSAERAAELPKTKHSIDIYHADGSVTQVDGYTAEQVQEAIAASRRTTGEACPICTDGQLIAAHVCNKCEAVTANAADLRANLAAPVSAGEAGQVAKAARALLDCLDGLPIDTDEATADQLTAFDRTRSRLQKALATESAAAPADAADALSTILWMYRRLPQAYGCLPSVEKCITALAAQTGQDVSHDLRERQVRVGVHLHEAAEGARKP